MDARNDATQRGSALVAALVLGVALLLVATTFLSVSLSERSIAANQEHGARAFGLAEAGIDHALVELGDADVDTLLGSGGALLTNEALGDGAYSVVVTNNIGPDYPTGVLPADAGGAGSDTDGYLVLTSTGSLEDSSRAIRVVVEKTSGGGSAVYKWAAFGRNRFKMSGGAQVIGPAGSNSDMSFSGAGPKIVGDAQAGGTISDPATYVSGTPTEGAPEELFPLVPCPATAWGPAPVGDSVSWDPSNGKLSISGDNTDFNADTYYFFSIKKSGGGMINFPADKKVTIYISDLLSMSGGGFNNPSGSSKNLEIIGCGPQSGGWTITGPQTSWFTIYAPMQKIKFTGEGDKYGSYIGIDFENTGPGRVIYDTGLASGGGTASVTTVRGSWIELW